MDADHRGRGSGRGRHPARLSRRWPRPSSWGEQRPKHNACCKLVKRILIWTSCFALFGNLLLCMMRPHDSHPVAFCNAPFRPATQPLPLGGGSGRGTRGSGSHLCCPTPYPPRRPLPHAGILGRGTDGWAAAAAKCLDCCSGPPFMHTVLGCNKCVYSSTHARRSHQACGFGRGSHAHSLWLQRGSWQQHTSAGVPQSSKAPCMRLRPGILLHPPRGTQAPPAPLSPATLAPSVPMGPDADCLMTVTP